MARTTRPSGTPWGLGIEARSRALVSEGEAAELLYREAIDRLGQCRGAVALARAHLVYGEWLRRQNRRADARVQLRTAYDMFARMGAEAESNPEIGAELFLSPRTVEWHLRKVFTKLGISSRRQLAAALPDLGHPALPT